MFSAVLTYHTNPVTCGVCKFNTRLARELGVPMKPLHHDAGNSLVSVKTGEIEHDAPLFLRPYTLFLHDVPRSGRMWHYRLLDAETVIAANRQIADAVRVFRPDVIEAWCPSTIEGNPSRGAINVLTFGMAHKIQTARYEQLKTLLDATGEDYTVSVSTAIHEGSPWDETALVGDKLRGIMGDKIRLLGYLGDDALSRELRECHAVALFFDPALRHNNTTFWAAHDAGCTIVTNLDAQSPNANGVYDVDDLQLLHEVIGVNWMRTHDRSWDKLTDLLCAK